MASAGLTRRLEVERLQIGPVGRIEVHRDAVIVAKHDAGSIEHTTDRRIELSGDLRLRSPDRPQDRRDLERRDLVNRPVEQRTRVDRTEMALPLR
jgi:hypothetical protein